MKNMNCSGVEELLDLYAAGECDSRTQKELRTHLAGCSSCQEKFDESRQLQGLLDLHHRASSALSRLQQRIAQEAQPSPGVLRLRPSVSRFAAVAALLLLVLGLSLWLPTISTSPEPPLALRAELAPISPGPIGKEDRAPVFAMRNPTEKREVIPGPARGKTDQPVAKIELNSKLLKEWQIEIARGKPAKAPSIKVQVTLPNPSNRVLFIRLEKKYRLDLSGPSVLRVPVGERTVRSRIPNELKIQPHGKATISIDGLVDFTNEGAHYLYPTAPGGYSLTVTLRGLAKEEGARQARPITIKAGPIPVVVEEKQ